MKLRRRGLISAPLVVVFAACSSEQDDQKFEVARQAIVDPSAPVEGTPMTGAMPLIPVTGLIKSALASETTSDSIHGGRFTDGHNLKAPNESDPALHTGTLCSTPAYLATPDYCTVQDEAIQSATTNFNALTLAKLVDSIEVPFKKLGLAVSFDPPETHFEGRKPVDAQWLARKWAPSVSTPSKDVEYIYDPPSVMDSMRLRAARLYCAAREAAKHTNSERVKMGERYAFKLEIFGKELKFFKWEPTFTVHPPEQYDGNGAHAFTLPMSAGLRYFVIDGLLPSFPEMRYPMNIATGESEILTKANVGTVNPISGAPKSTHRDTWMGMTQGSSYVTQSAGFTPSVSIPLWQYPPGPAPVFEAKAEIAFPMEWGSPVSAEDWDAVDTAVYDGPYFHNSLTASDFRRPRGGANIDREWTDGFWRLGLDNQGTTVGPIMQGFPFEWQVGLSPGLTPVSFETFTSKLMMRAFQSDDHVVAANVKAGLSVGISGTFQTPPGFPLRLELSALGSITGNAVAEHVMRDGLSAREGVLGGSLEPAASLSVRPRGYYEAVLGFSADAAIVLKWPFGDWSKTWKLFEKDFTLGKTKAAEFTEAETLRIATDAPGGKVLQPFAFSHLPGGTNYESFPTDLMACLADTTPIADSPAPMESVPEPEERPSANICLVWHERSGPPLSSTPICDDPGAYVALTGLSGAKEECLNLVLQFMCEPISSRGTSTVAPFVGRRSVSRVLALADEGQNNELNDIFQQCGEAYSEGISPDSAKLAAATAYMEDTFRLATCDPEGLVYEQPVKIETPPTGNPCKATTCEDATKGECGWCAATDASYPGNALGAAPGYPTCTPPDWKWTKAECE